METFVHTIINGFCNTCSLLHVALPFHMQQNKILLNAVMYLGVEVLLICCMFLHASACRPNKNTCIFRMNMYILLYTCISPDSTCKNLSEILLA